MIVESPAKAKTIEKFLGKGYVVKSSFGHIRDLSKKELGIDIQNDFTPHYEISPDKKKTVAELEKLAKEAGTVWLRPMKTARGGHRVAPVPGARAERRQDQEDRFP